MENIKRFDVYWEDARMVHRDKEIVKHVAFIMV